MFELSERHLYFFILHQKRFILFDILFKLLTGRVFIEITRLENFNVEQFFLFY